MEFSFDARLPESYIDAVSVRMEIYHRLGEANDLQEIDHLFEEIEDRFGKAPLPVLWLYRLNKIRALATQKGYTSIQFHDLSCTLEKQTKEQIEKRTILLPKKVQTPEKLESHMFEII
jgi:transcription-repair coupling factor (superfamily II helicase)